MIKKCDEGGCDETAVAVVQILYFSPVYYCWIHKPAHMPASMPSPYE